MESFYFDDKRSGMLHFLVSQRGELFCNEWGNLWRFIGMERNGEQFVYRFEFDYSIREYILPSDFIAKVEEKVKIRVNIKPGIKSLVN